ncbi:unnamed protein product [Paramecium primaurelia]|uniref:WD40-repeat-containing domain n=1 Tax=Paramecium primaurelia TaxID=5886 RepID=A0A8S1PD17_PARPR|nr:unnamed protein product [Paramecium primaurelia]
MGNNQKKLNQPLYELQDSSTFKMKYPSYSIAINQSGSLILTNVFSTILIIGYNGKSFKSLSSVKKHESCVSVLKFFNLREQFISGSGDYSIIIWPTILGTTKYIQKLQGHRGMITCLTIHPLNEDLIISGDYKSTIRFWSIQKSLNKQQTSLQWICIQEIIELKSSVCSISINEIGNQVISCDRNSLILVIEKSINTNNWFVKQKIDVESLEGAGVSFLKDDRFIFQSSSESTLNLYVLQQEGKYNKIQQVQLKKYKDDIQIRQTLLYKNKQNILTIKKGEKLFIIKIEDQNNSNKNNTNNDQLILKYVQKIDFKTWFFYQALSDNGQYLVTKDNESKQMKMWNLKKEFEH